MAISFLDNYQSSILNRLIIKNYNIKLRNQMCEYSVHAESACANTRFMLNLHVWILSSFMLNLHVWILGSCENTWFIIESIAWQCLTCMSRSNLENVAENVLVSTDNVFFYVGRNLTGPYVDCLKWTAYNRQLLLNGPYGLSHVANISLDPMPYTEIVLRFAKSLLCSRCFLRDVFLRKFDKLCTTHLACFVLLR